MYTTLCSGCTVRRKKRKKKHDDADEVVQVMVILRAVSFDNWTCFSCLKTFQLSSMKRLPDAVTSPVAYDTALRNNIAMNHGVLVENTDEEYSHSVYIKGSINTVLSSR